MKLFFSPTSPYVRKCLIAAHELGLVDRIQLLPSSAHPVQRDARIIASNPLGKVPTLITDQGQALYDSRVICEYLDQLAGGGKLFPAAGPARWSALTLQALGDGILDGALLARYEDAARPEPLRWSDLAYGTARQGRDLAGGPRERPCRIARLAEGRHRYPASPVRCGTWTCASRPTSIGAAAMQASRAGMRGSPSGLRLRAEMVALKAFQHAPRRDPIPCAAGRCASAG